MTDTSEQPEAREDDRAAVTLKVDYKRLNTFFADYTKNISKGGTFIRTAQPLELGTEFRFELTVPSADTTEDGAPSGEIRLQLTGVVKWIVSEAEATVTKPAGMGIQFVFADAAEREKVQTIVTDLMKASLGEHLARKLLNGA
ncbi:MAG: TIGR02266 family protein [Labilithrix sp.]|nr:TIGR02266 family protein [Labilithrix sp.]MCW5818038.1 TIGR02266 family protein [Labilithrix sp.]